MIGQDVPLWVPLATALIAAAVALCGVGTSALLHERERRQDQARRYHQALLDHGVEFIRRLQEVEDYRPVQSGDELRRLVDRLDHAYRFLQVVAPEKVYKVAQQCKKNAQRKQDA